METYHTTINTWPVAYNMGMFVNWPKKELGLDAKVFVFNGPDTTDAIVFATSQEMTEAEALQLAIASDLLDGWEINHADLPVFAKDSPDAITWHGYVPLDLEELRCDLAYVRDFWGCPKVAEIFA